MALMISGLCCLGRFIVSSSVLGIMVGCVVVSFSFWSPSVAFMSCDEWSSCREFFYIYVCVLKPLTGLRPMSMLRIGYLPPLWIYRRSWRIFNVILCLEIPRFALYVHSHKRCPSVRG